MSLSYHQPPKLINKTLRSIARVRQAVFGTINSYFVPDKMILLFFIIASILAFLKIAAIGFYVVFGLFIVGYFADRIITKLEKRKKIKLRDQ